MIFLQEIASRKIFLGAYLALKFQKKHKNEIIRRKIRAKNTRRYEKHARKKNQKKFHRSLRIRRSGVRVSSGAPRSLAIASDLFLFVSPAFAALSKIAYVSRLSFSNEVHPCNAHNPHSKARPSPFAGDRRASVQVYFSNSFATSCSSCLMGRCWGQTRSHLPQRMQSEAREPGPVWTSS